MPKASHSGRTHGEHSLKTCLVSFTDPDGFRHSVEVQAHSLYEAVAIAARSFADAGCPPTQGTELDIQVRVRAITHFGEAESGSGLGQWSSQKPRDKLLKERLKDLLSTIPLSQTSSR